MKISKNVVAVLVLLGVVATLAGCSSATPTATPGVESMGQYVLRQFGPELWTVIGYRFANTQQGDEWLFLEVGLSSPSGQSAKVTRGDIFLTTPAGTRVPLATQVAFGEAFGSLRSTISRANINRDPLDYFPTNRVECPIQFFVEPGRGVSFDEVTLNSLRGCYGRLYFQVPGGIQEGRWVFNIYQPESEIRIPFELAE